jgi:predicted DNA-binding antitoxin AbrB/MazE fold protein
MKKIYLSLLMVLICFFSLSKLAFSDTNPIYYGWLPGTDYKYFKPLQKIDLKGKEFNVEIIDARGTIKKVECFEYEIDRDTELEGELGLNYFSNYLKTMIEHCNGKVNPESKNKITVKVEGISFMIYGFIFARVHGLVQFEVSSLGITKKYCSDMTDADNDSPASQFAMVTRKTGSRLIVSGSMRRALESLMLDLQK